MSEENVDLVRAMLAEAGDRPEALYEILAPDVEWDAGAIGQLELSTCQGRDAVMQFFRLWVAPFDDWGYDVEELLDCGDSVVVRIHQWGRGKGSGASVEGRFWQVWTLRGGKVIRTTHHRDKTRALEAAALPG
jgi:ketosteroid isomerase-like protein